MRVRTRHSLAWLRLVMQAKRQHKFSRVPQNNPETKSQLQLEIKRQFTYDVLVAHSSDVIFTVLACRIVCKQKHTALS